MVKVNVNKILKDRKTYEKEYTAEEFGENIITPQFYEALRNEEQLEINFDGGYGYTLQFIRGIFNDLKSKYEKRLILKTLVIISEDEPSLIDNIIKHIKSKEEVNILKRKL